MGILEKLDNEQTQTVIRVLNIAILSFYLNKTALAKSIKMLCIFDCITALSDQMLPDA